MDHEIITLYVCPTVGCGNYYGTDTMGDLHVMEIFAPLNAKDAGQFRNMRSKCPRCGTDRKKRYAKLIPENEVAMVQQAVRKAAKSSESYEEMVETGRESFGPTGKQIPYRGPNR